MTITVDDTAVIAALDTVIFVEKRLMPKMRELTDRLNKAARLYPPAPAGSTYRRTFRLQDSWTTSIIVGTYAIGGYVTSAGVEYNAYVKDPQLQAQVHRGRHKTTQDVVDDNEDYALELFKGEIQTIINRSA